MINAIADFFQNIFSPIVAILGQVLLFFHNTLGAPWWLSIALLTVVIRTLLFPLTVKQVKSMRAMQDRQFGGYSLGGRTVPPEYRSFHEGGILWFQNLSVADPYYILPVVSALTMLAATEITAKNIDPQQRWLMRLLPIGITVFLFNFPAGLFVYWITSNLVTLTQNYVIYHHGPGRRPPLANAGGKSAGRGGPASAGNGARAPENGHQTDGDSGSPGAPTDDAAAQAAKAAKRKRRKKKKK
jgi:YidC/Oxa1 family membrane protein insertase